MQPYGEFNTNPVLDLTAFDTRLYNTKACTVTKNGRPDVPVGFLVPQNASTVMFVAS